MHLSRLKIREFRNLRDFEITFTPSAKDADGTARDFKSHAVIGQNGSGKSNMIEAIVTILRDLDLNEAGSLDYELDYSIRGFQIAITGKKGVPPSVIIDGQMHESWELSDMHRENPKTGEIERGHARRYLPSHIFTYYSGKNVRLEELFQRHQEHYIENLDEFQERRDSDSLLRRLFYCRHPHSRLVLLACLLAPEKPLHDLLHTLGIEDVDSALFVLKKPFRMSGELTEADIKEGDIRFWFDQSRFSQEFLAKLWELATAPVDFTEEKTIDFRGRTEEQELIYLFIKDRAGLSALKEYIGDSYRFFQYIEGAFVADLIDDLNIFVQHRTAQGLLTFEALSEGELQLLTVLGLMRITNEDHCLFLLDEPDTHLNPIWKLRYFEEIEKVLQQDAEKTIKGDSQIIITTHDPMMIGGLRKEQVRILKCESGKATVETPDEHPQGMGVAGLLKSELFGLPSTLDRHTLKQLQRRNELLALKAKKALTAKQDEELKKLRDQLDDLGFSREYRDPLYQQFIEQMYAVRSLPLDKILSPKQLKKQEALAKKIIKKIVRTEKTDELSALAQELKIAVSK